MPQTSEILTNAPAWARGLDAQALHNQLTSSGGDYARVSWSDSSTELPALLVVVVAGEPAINAVVSALAPVERHLKSV